MRRNTKTMYEWRKAYRDKEELMLERGFPEVSPHEFYRDLFPEGSLQSAEHDGKGNLIATQIRPSGKGRTKQWVVDDSLNMLDRANSHRALKSRKISAIFFSEKGKKNILISLRSETNIQTPKTYLKKRWWNP